MCGDSSNLKVIQADTLERFPSKYCLMTGFFRCSRSLKVRGVWARKTTISIMLYNQPGPHRESRISGLEVLPGRFCTVLLLLCDCVSVFFFAGRFFVAVVRSAYLPGAASQPVGEPRRQDLDESSQRFRRKALRLGSRTMGG